MVGEGESRPAKRTVRLFGAGLSVVKSTSGSREPALVSKEIFRDSTEPVLTLKRGKNGIYILVGTVMYQSHIEPQVKLPVQNQGHADHLPCE